MIRFDAAALYLALEAARQARGVSFAQISQETGVSVATIRRARSGGRMEVDGVLALTRWLGRPIEDFTKQSPI
jgi:transcriptional regulator with XRE-family HTH domain